MANPPGEKGNMDAAADQLNSMSIGDRKAGSDIDASAKSSNFGGNAAGSPARLPEQFCSACGKTGVANQDLKQCNGCKCVWYCGAACQKAHWKAHKKECKLIGLVIKERAQTEAPQCVKAKATNADDDSDDDVSLFEHVSRDDCEICMRVLPIEASLSRYMPCCGKMVCCGCFFECGLVTKEINEKKAKKNQDLLKDMCAFCRHPYDESEESTIRQMEKGVERGDSVAMKQLGLRYQYGGYGLPVDHTKALDLLVRSSDLGQAEANDCLARAYMNGDLGLDIDEAKAAMYEKRAAKAGHVISHYNLGQTEFLRGNVKRAISHWHIAAAAGFDEAVMCLMSRFEEGNITLEELAAYMQARDKTAIEINSDERNRAKKMMIARGIYRPPEIIS